MTAIFATAQQLADLLYNYNLNTTGSTENPEATILSLDKLLKKEALSITGEWNSLYKRMGFEIPTEQSDPPSALDLILELLNLETVLAKLIQDILSAQYEVYANQVKTIRMVADTRRGWFRSGKLKTFIVKHFRSDPISNENYLDDSRLQELAGDVQGFTITPYTQPSIDTASRVALRESCFLRAVAVNAGYSQESLSDEKLQNYGDLVISMSSPTIARISLMPEYTPLIDNNIFKNYQSALYDLCLVFSGNVKFRSLL